MSYDLLLPGRNFLTETLLFKLVIALSVMLVFRLLLRLRLVFWESVVSPSLLLLSPPPLLLSPPSDISTNWSCRDWRSKEVSSSSWQ